MSIGKRSSSIACRVYNKCRRTLYLGLFFAIVPVVPAFAQLSVSQLIVELKPGVSRAADIEIYNDSDERNFVSVEPREIVDAGLAGEKPLLSPDPEKLGLLVSPTRMVIEPRQRRRLRIAAIGLMPARERVYRVTVKPVAGDVTGAETGLKLLVGYDLLVLVRPPASKPIVDARRTSGFLTIVNRGLASVELAGGKQCDGDGRNCQALPSKRLYAGASWRQSLPRSSGGEYRIRSSDRWSTVKF